MSHRVVRVATLVNAVLVPRLAGAQDDPSPWMLMSDGVLFATVNHQGGPRGGDEFVSTNWWMGMASRSVGRSQLTLTGMLSLDPASATGRGYRELFQTGEVYHGQPIVDRPARSTRGPPACGTSRPRNGSSRSRTACWWNGRRPSRGTSAGRPAPYRGSGGGPADSPP